MLWYSGNISEAINLCKTQNSLFIVLVEDDSHEDQADTSSNNVWDDAEVNKIFSEHQYVALKLKANSELAKQFSQIFATKDPVFVYPTLYFISSHGRPLETKVGHMSVNSLIQSAKRAFDLHDVSLHPMTSTSEAETSTGTATAATTTITTAAAATTSTTPATTAELNPSNPSAKDLMTASASTLEDDKTTQADKKREAADHTDSAAAAAVGAEGNAAESGELSQKDEPLSLEEKTEKAKRLLANKQEAHAKAYAAKERQKELERRKLGQDMKRLKDLKADLERIELERELKDKKEADRLAREQIRRQLQMDREERAKKYYSEKEEAVNKQLEKEKEKSAAEIEKIEKENAAKMAVARIQFRFPDGSSKVNQFNSSDHLSVARLFALQCLPASFRNISLSTIHPRKVFKGDDYDQTFLHHSLAPSAVLVVLPTTSTDVPPPSASVVASSNDGNFLFAIWTQIFLFFQYMLSFIFPSLSNDNSSALPASVSRTATTTDDNTAATAAASDDTSQLKHTFPPSSSSAVAAATHSEPLPSTSLPSVAFGGARPKTSDGLRKRKEGNIHRLVADDEDDEQATWNGNSTQQM